MESWLSGFFKRFKSLDIDYKMDLAEYRRFNVYEILNIALSLSMEFGPNLHQPINSRLKKAFPKLSRKEIRG
jgi:hypothetical protein